MEYARYSPASMETTDRVVAEWQKNQDDGGDNTQGGKKKKKKNWELLSLVKLLNMIIVC